VSFLDFLWANAGLFLNSLNSIGKCTYINSCCNLQTEEFAIYFYKTAAAHCYVAIRQSGECFLKLKIDDC